MLNKTCVVLVPFLPSISFAGCDGYHSDPESASFSGARSLLMKSLRPHGDDLPDAHGARRCRYSLGAGAGGSPAARFGHARRASLPTIFLAGSDGSMRSGSGDDAVKDSQASAPVVDSDDEEVSDSSCDE